MNIAVATALEDRYLFPGVPREMRLGRLLGLSVVLQVLNGHRINTLVNADILSLVY